MNDTPELLPFVMRHGTAIWWGIAVTGTVIVVIGSVLLTRWSAGRAERQRAKLGAANAIVRGTLRSATSGVQVQSVDARRYNPDNTFATEGTVASATWRDPAVWLETQQGRVTLEGPIAVIAGTSSRRATNRIPEGAHDALITALEASWDPRSRDGTTTLRDATLRGLRAGDDVAVGGRLDPIASTEPSAYRESLPSFVLRPAAGKSAIELTARCPRAPRQRLPYGRITVLWLIVGLAGWKFADAQGDRWQRECSSGNNGESLMLSNTHACALMMATPGDRDFGSLVYALRYTASHDAPWRRTAVALGIAGTRCDEAIDLLAGDEQFADVVTVAHACHLPRQEYRALAQLGRFDEAASIVVPREAGATDLPTPEAYVAAGRWTDAARALDAAREVARRETVEPERQPWHEATLAQYSCAADLARFYGGDASARARIHATFASPAGDACAAAVYELATPAERAAFDLSRDRPASFEARLALSHLHIADRGTPVGLVTTPSDAVRSPTDAYYDLPFVWLMKTNGTPPTTSIPLAWAAVGAAYDARYADAIALAKRAVAVADAEVPHRADLDYLAATIALYTPSTTEPAHLDATTGLTEWNFHAGHIQLRAGTISPDAYLGPESTLAAALRAAMAGDGTELAQVMSAKFSWWHDIDVMAVLPRITTGRDQIAELLETHRSTDSGRTWYGSRNLFEVVGRAIARRGVLTLAGRTESAAVWDAVYRRLDKVLADRKRLVTLMVLP